MRYINKYGIATDSINGDDFYIIEGNSGNYDYEGRNIFYELDNFCVSLYDSIQLKLFPSREEYYQEMKSNFYPVYQVGIDSEAEMSKSDFERFITKERSEKLHRHLYLSDCHSIIGALQNRLLFIDTNLIEFYRSLEALKSDHIKGTKNVFTAGHKTTPIFSGLYSIFITLYSAFDLITKLGFEFIKTRNDFTKYPRLVSTGKLYGDWRKMGIKESHNTIYADMPLNKMIVNLRNELIHNGGWEMNPKVYLKIESGRIIKKDIYFPDTKDGKILTYGNRKRFFSSCDKVNEMLPNIISEITGLILNTLKEINKST